MELLLFFSKFGARLFERPVSNYTLIHSQERRPIGSERRMPLLLMPPVPFDVDKYSEYGEFNTGPYFYDTYQQCTYG